MSFNFIRLCQDRAIPFLTEGHRHCRPGWVQVKCPYCTGHEGWHLGHPIGGWLFWCWRCGFHPLVQTVADLTGLSKSHAYKLIDEYAGRPTARYRKKNKTYADKCILPKNQPLRIPHKKYLRDRGFHADDLAKMWDLRATLKTGEYKNRILIPIYLDGVLISFQGRDITERARAKYKASKAGNEVISHQDSLYGIDEVPGRSVIVVEGVADAWRFGPGAVATFGIDWSYPQVNLLRRFSFVHILFDKEPLAEQKAEELAVAVQTETTAVWIHTIEDRRYKDPAELPQDMADAWMQHLKTFEKEQQLGIAPPSNN